MSNEAEPIIEMMTTPNHALSATVGEILSQIRELYSDQFDRTWFTSALRDFPLESRQFLDIRHALTLTAPTVWDLPVLHRGVAALEIYVRLIRQTILPRASQLFGFSGSGRPNYEYADDSRLHRRLVAYTLPLNLERLASLVRELKKVLPPIPPSMPSLRAIQGAGALRPSLT